MSKRNGSSSSSKSRKNDVPSINKAELSKNISAEADKAVDVMDKSGLSIGDIVTDEASDRNYSIEEVNNMFKSAMQIKKTYEKAKEKLDALQANIDSQSLALDKKRKEIEDEKSKFTTQQTELNDRELKLIQKEQNFIKKESSGIIAGILERIQDSSQEIDSKIDEIKGELASYHIRAEKELAEITKKAADLNQRELEIKKREESYEIDKDDLEYQKEEFEEDCKERYRHDSAEDKLRILKLQHQLNEEKIKYEKVSTELGAIYSVFGHLAPASIYEEYNNMKTQNAAMQSELNKRMTKAEEDNLRTQYAELVAERDLTKTLELKSHAFDFEKKEMEVAMLQQQLEVYKTKVDSLNEFIKDSNERHKKDIETIQDDYNKSRESLQATLTRLLEAKDKNNSAFQFVLNCERPTSVSEKQSTKILNPNSLKDMVDYLQKKLAKKQWPNEAKRDALRYSKETIRIFIAGLYMSPLSILQGISGTGKTSLPKEVAKALFCGDSDYSGEDAPYRRIAIQSGWRDNMDLMGNYNSFEARYNETDFFKALYLADRPKYSNTLFLIILDEMNLSRPEYYFADFLSLIEESEGNRKIYLQNVPSKVIPQSIKRDSNGSPYLIVPKNVRFVGTANHDETTAEFAPKTYDRSNVMDMPTNPPTTIDGTEKEIREMCATYEWLEGEFKKAFDQYNSQAVKFHEFLSIIKDDLAKVGIGVGNRFDKQATKFISAYIAMGSDKKTDLAYASDFLIKSRLFRTLRNNYDITEQEFITFRDNYITSFEIQFNGERPQLGIELLKDIYIKNFKKEKDQE